MISIKGVKIKIAYSWDSRKTKILSGICIAIVIWNIFHFVMIENFLKSSPILREEFPKKDDNSKLLELSVNISNNYEGKFYGNICKDKKKYFNDTFIESENMNESETQNICESSARNLLSFGFVDENYMYNSSDLSFVKIRNQTCDIYETPTTEMDNNMPTCNGTGINDRKLNMGGNVKPGAHIFQSKEEENGIWVYLARMLGIMESHIFFINGVLDKLHEDVVDLT